MNVEGSMFARRSQRGMALVITLILLAVITFLAVTFLAVSRRDRAVVATMTDQTTAKLAADAAFERARAELLVPILAATNFANYGLMVSTSYVNSVGYNPAAGDNPTNVNYDFTTGGGALNNDQFRQNIANLLYSPRVPVFVRTNTALNAPLDFRFYLDLNRNRRYDTNGFLPEVNQNGLFISVNGGETASTNQARFTNFVGDPEWIGILEKPDQPHSPSNRFIARYAFIAVPSGKTLDINYIHNQAYTRTVNGLNDGFFRNQGVGTWEINLAAFLADLNTNTWLGGLEVPDPTYYQYDRPGFRNQGLAFMDAFSLLANRYGQIYGNLNRADQLFANNAALIPNDGIDQYTDGPLYTTNSAAPDNDQVNNNWVGSDTPNHLFTTQDFYDVAKSPEDFRIRISNAGGRVAYYDRYTFYRMLDQLGTDSGPEGDKINVNYVNVDARGKVNHNLATNFTVWRAEQFFTNAADRLVRLYSQDWVRTERTNFIRNFNVQDSFALTNIPVWISNRFVYSPSIHRLMQVTANIYDVQTNRVYQAVNPGQNTQPYLPSVFRPKFRREVQAGSYTNLYISGFVEVAARDDHDDVRRRPTFDLNRVADRNVLFNTLTESALSDVNIYGVPIVIGAKKGLPNFNKFALETVSQITRKLELRRLTADSPVNRTNTMYLVSVSNVVAAVEVWNSYATNYTRGVGIFASNDMSICLVVTNENGPPTVRSLDVGVSGSTFIAANDWPARASKVSSRDTAVAASFRVPLNTNIFFLPTSVYRPASRTFQPASDAVFDGPEFYQPRFYLTVTNRLRFYMTDEATGRIIDYVHLNDLDTKLNLSDVIADDNNALGAKGLWITNRSGGNSVLNPTEGILNQLEVSLGNVFISDALWRDEGGIGNRDDEQNKFKAFINGTGTAGGDSLVAQAPYNASAKISQLMIWQANDPLVHYTAADLQNPAAGNGIQPLSVASAANTLAMTSKLNVFNDRYEPWGRDGGIVSTVPAYKDPMIRSSDDWDFPTNKLPNVGWLGRVHRGTPWQTIYMKSGDVLANANDFKNWRLWSGHTRLFELTNMAPRADRLLFDVFTAAVNENATRGQLSVNQQGPAAWSAVLSGVVVLTNTHPDPAKDKTPLYEAKVINPAGPNTNSATWRMIKGIQRQRERQVVIEQPQRATNDAYPGRAFAYVGDILSVPELTDQSPFLNRPTGTGLRERIRNYSLDDAAYERIPQQIMGLLRVDDEPRFTIYAFGQALKPAPRSIITSGNQFGLCTNYQVTAEMATRTVVRVKGAPRPGDAVGATPEVLVERFNVLGPD